MICPDPYRRTLHLFCRHLANAYSLRLWAGERVGLDNSWGQMCGWSKSSQVARSPPGSGNQPWASRPMTVTGQIIVSNSRFPGRKLGWAVPYKSRQNTRISNFKMCNSCSSSPLSSCVPKNQDHFSSYCICKRWSNGFLQSFGQRFWKPDFYISWNFWAFWCFLYFICMGHMAKRKRNLHISTATYKNERKSILLKNCLA